MNHSFQSQWDTHYPNKLPISYDLVQNFPQFWFRIHSLPESKRYADTAAVTWQMNQHNDLLKKIADDEIRAFMISFERKIIVAPYDGGIDFIIFDEKKRKYLKNKYKA